MVRGRKREIDNREKVTLYLSAKQKAFLEDVCSNIEPVCSLAAFIRWAIDSKLEELGHEGFKDLKKG